LFGSLPWAIHFFLATYFNQFILSFIKAEENGDWEKGGEEAATIDEIYYFEFFFCMNNGMF
jgi:hypothetical protein